MSWQGLPATSDTDWAKWNFRAQFAKALYERGLACGRYSLPTPDYDTYQDGWDAHGLTNNAFSVKHIQAEIEAMISSFIRPVDWAGASAPPDYYWRSHFWLDMGAPEEARPAEDLQMGWQPGDIHDIAVGGRYGVRKPASGDWAGHDSEIAVCTGGDGIYDPWTWSFQTPADGYRIARRYWDDGAWHFGGYFRRDAGEADWVSTDRIGWTRKYPRQIERVTDEGEAGQRARVKGTGENLNAGAGTRWLTVRTDPPETPYVNGFYGVQEGATGVWADQDGKLASWDGAQWNFIAVDDGSQYLFNAVVWWQSPYPLKARRNAYACVREHARWHRVGTIYEHDGSGWVEAEDQDSPPDLVVDYGQAAEGDYAGEWLFNELQVALRQLHVVKADSSSWGGHEAHKDAGGSEWQDTWDDAKADCMDAWVNGDPPEEQDQDWGYGGPSCYNYGLKTVYGYSASMDRIHRRHRLTFPAGDPAVKCDVRFYVIGAALDFTDAINDFDAMGDPIANGSAVKWYEVLAVDSADEYVSPLWQATKTNTAPQPWCADPIACPPDPHGEQVTTNGYLAADHFGTKDFAVTGGFRYQ